MINQQVQNPLVSPHGDRTIGRRLEQTNRQPPIQAPDAAHPHDLAHRVQRAGRLGDVLVDVAAARRALHLDALAHEVEREHGRLRGDAREHARRRVAAPEGQAQVVPVPPERHAQRLVRREEQPHVRHDLGEGGRQAPEEPPDPLVPRDVPHRPPQRRVHAVVALGREPRP